MWGNWTIRYRTQLNRFFGKGNWHILCQNKDGENEVWTVSNHVQKANNSRYFLLSSKRLKARQALTLELMDISFAVVEEEVRKEILGEFLTEEEAACFRLDMSYHGGNPKGPFYDKLAKESWFTIDGVTLENYLASDLYDFYIDIGIHEYKLEALSRQEQQNVINSLAGIEEKMLDEYGDNASFQIIYDDFKAEYEDGMKVN